MAKKPKIRAPRGMHDVLPQDQLYWQYIIKKSRPILEDYGFEKIDTPVVESAELFTRSIGSSTDVIEKEMYTLKTKGGDVLALRPEFTAGIVRAYIEHGMHVLPHPIQLWSVGPLFRHDRPQANRFRQFNQLNAEAYGDESAAIDAMLIFVAYRIVESLGLKNVVVKINSIGDSNCRPAYLKVLKDYFKGRSKKMCSSCQARSKTNTLRMLDCSEKVCREITSEAPQVLDYLDNDCKKHFKEVFEFLDELKVPYLLDHRLVRGLDYYTRTVFEIWPEEEDEEKPTHALCSGGRYDKLVSQLDGPKTPASGWAMGIERIVNALKENKVKIPAPRSTPKVFIAQLGELAKRKSLRMFEEFRRAGISAKASFGRDSIKAQLKIANRMGIKYTLLIGQKEALDETVIIREMRSGVQETVPMDKVLDKIKQKT